MITHRRRAGELAPGQLYALLKLRVDVFVVEQKAAYPELDGRDLEPGTAHYWVSEDGQVLGCLRVLAEPDGSARIGRVCTVKEARGKGVGRMLMDAALAANADRVLVL